MSAIFLPCLDASSSPKLYSLADDSTLADKQPYTIFLAHEFLTSSFSQASLLSFSNLKFPELEQSLCSPELEFKHQAEQEEEERIAREKAQQIEKNMDGWKPRAFKNKSFAEVKELFDKAMTRINNFVDFRTDFVKESSKKAEESSSKRVGDELEQESAKQKGRFGSTLEHSQKLDLR
nr:hypothetical protein [Tanacetum cinerariifolium]